MKIVNDVLKAKGHAVWSVAPSDTVFNAICNMAEHEVGALLVVDNEDPIGIVSERDYTRKVILRDRSSKLTRVEEIMTREVIFVSPEYRVEACIGLMKEHHVRHLPVFDNGRVTGMLSSRDLFSATIDDQAHAIEDLQHYIRGEVG